jgi:zinc D-Ala-D-Ala carboxypeptidase
MLKGEDMESISVIGYRDDYRLSPHFTYGEFTISQTAIRKNIINQPNENEMRNLEALCENILEPLRTHFGNKYVEIHSGFRCKKLNTAIGGSGRSQHRFGEAADIKIPPNTIQEIFEWVILDSGLAWDQIIWEFDKWIHISHKRVGTNRYKNTLATKSDAGKTVYNHYSKEEILAGISYV